LVAQRRHQDLLAWQEAMALAKSVYALTSGFPREETYGLTAQMRRAAVSIPSNIAEGAARATTKEFLHFLHVARGSLSELDTQLRLAQDFGYTGDYATPNAQAEQVFKLLAGLINSIKARD
jgi:four helix bundle protein